MGWKTDLHDASFRSIGFVCLSATDAVQKVQVIQQAPYSDKASITDQGADPRRVSLRAIIKGDSYKVFADALENALLQRGTGELIHPIYGIQQVNVLDYNIQHNPSELWDGCYVDMNFIEGDNDVQPLFVPLPSIQKIDLASITAAPAATFQAELEQLQQQDPNSFFDTVARIRNGLQSARRRLGVVRTTIDDILSPPEFVRGIVDDVTGLVNFDVTDISAISKWRNLANQVQRIGDVFTDSDGHNDTPAFKQLWRSTTIAATVATAQAIVDKTRTEMATAGNNSGASLTPPELATIRQHVRTEIQIGIDAERATSSDIANNANIDPAAQVAIYKTVADQVHVQIQELIETRPPIITTTVEVMCSIHWLAHQLYGDMTRADEIKRLNPTLENFAVLRTGMELTAYAR